MKIIFVAPRFHTNQIGVVRALRERGHEVEFHVTRVGATEDHSIVTPTVFKHGLLSRFLQKLRQKPDPLGALVFPPFLAYFRLLSAKRPDIVIARNPSRPFSLLAATCARLIGARVIFYTQTPLYYHYGLLGRFSRKLLLVVFNAAWMTPVLGDKRVAKPLPHFYFVPFAVYPEEANCLKPQSDDAPLQVLMVAKYLDRKNHELLCRALSAIDSRVFFHLTVIGQCGTNDEIGRKERIKKLCTEVGIENKVTFRDNVPVPLMSSYYRNADLLVLPSSLEPASISILEAICNGTPVLCSDTCGTRFYIEPSVTGALFRDGNAYSLSETLFHLMRDRATLTAMRSRCLASARRQFSSDAYYEALLALLNGRWPSECHANDTVHKASS